MTDANVINELMEYHFHDITLKQLYEVPYKEYVDMYKELSKDYIFLIGYKYPDKQTRASVYSAIYNTVNIYPNRYQTFISNIGLTVMYHYKYPDEKEKYDGYYNEGIKFIPPKYDTINIYEIDYYMCLLEEFKKAEQLTGDIIHYEEHQSIFIFFRTNVSIDYDTLWNNFITGNIVRQITIPYNQIFSLYNQIKFYDRLNNKITVDNKIECYFKTDTVEEYDKIKSQLSEENVNYIILDEIINDNNEAYGVCQYFEGDIIPLIGTNRVYVRGSIKFKPIVSKDTPIDGVEIFSQDSFDQMNIYRKSSLTKINNNWYNILDIVKCSKDPITREDLNTKITLNAPKTFLYGINIEFELSLKFNIDNDEIYMYINDVPIWIISKNDQFTDVLINLFIKKWSDKSILIPNYRIYDNPILYFIPKISHIFKSSPQMGCIILMTV